MDKTKILELFYRDKNYSKIKELLKNSTESWSFNLLGKIALQEVELEKAYENFNKANNLYACAYCKFLEGDLNEARIMLALIKNHSPASNWLLSLINVIYDDYSFEPTYFQIRNFYEQDLEMLILHKQIEIFNQIVKRNHFFSIYNREIYKYSARVFMNNKYYEQAKILIQKSLDICYKDPETHFMLGEIYENQGLFENSKNSFKKSIEVNGEYAPAKEKLNRLSN